MLPIKTSCRTLLSSLICFITALTYSGSVGAQTNILIFSSGDESQDRALESLIEGYGHNVILEDEYPSYIGGGLAGVDVVVLQSNPNKSVGDMPLTGQEELLNFVASGGGLIATKALVRQSDVEGKLTSLRDVLPVETDHTFRTAPTVTYTQSSLNPVLNAGLPASFSFDPGHVGGDEAFLAPRPGATVFFESDFDKSGKTSGGVIGWNYGAGRVLTFSTLMVEESQEEADYSRLIHNSIMWTTSVPEPSAGLLTILGMMGWCLHRRRMS